MKKVVYEHFGRFRSPYNLRARGNALYFCVKTADFEENRYRSDLWRLRDGETRRLTAAGDVGDYYFLPAGIVFPALREKKDREQAEKGVPLTVLQCLPWDGGEAQELLRLPYAVTGLRFLSETRFFFTARYSRAYAEALAACGGDADKAAERLKEDADYTTADEIPFWENGGGFINGMRSRLYLYDGGTVTPLTDEWTAVTLSALSPDGKTLWYIAVRYTDVQPVADRLFALDTATLTSRDCSLSNTAAHYGAFPTAEGGLALLASRMGAFGLNENPALYLRESGHWRLLCGGGEHCFGDSVGSDVRAGRSLPPDPPAGPGALYLLDTQDDSSRLVRVDLADGGIENVTRAPGDVSEAVGYGGGFAAVAMRGGDGGEIYAVSPDGGETRLTDLNTALSAEYAYSAPQELVFSNADGDTIRGWVIPPVDLVPGKKYPAILDIHGGPKTAYGACYFHEMQLWAARGFAVLFCNPRGSDGRGDAFADIRGDYGGRDFSDIMAFTDRALEAFPFLDADRLGVTGGSYGGFMTNWIIGHTDRFRAAASQRSIANWLSFRNTSDIGWYFGEDQTAADPWGAPEKMWAQSPLKYADKVTTPTLFIHSDEDYRCPLSEGLQMFYAVRAKGVPARLVIFRGENHELSRSGKPKHRVRRLREITEWMEKYLKSGE